MCTNNDIIYRWKFCRSIINQNLFISRFHIFIKLLFSNFRKYTLLTLENVSISDSRINIFPPLSVSNCKLARENLPKHKPRRPKPISDRYPESHSTQLISSQFLILLNSISLTPLINFLSTRSI